MITDNGKTYIKRYLAGQYGVIGSAIALGIGQGPEAGTNVDMSFEFARVDVDLVSYDFVGDALVFKGELPLELAGKIYEVGLWSMDEDSKAEAYGSKILASFDSDTETWSAGTYVTTNTRVGADSLELAPAASATLTTEQADLLFDLSGHSGNDTFSLAYNVSGVSPTSIVVRFRTDTANYYSGTISNPGTGYKISTMAKSSFTATGTPSWENITSIQIIVTAAAGGAAVVELDALRVNDSDTDNPDYILVARELLTVPYVKAEGVIQEIEFAIPVAIA